MLSTKSTLEKENDSKALPVTISWAFVILNLIQFFICFLDVFFPCFFSLFFFLSLSKVSNKISPETSICSIYLICTLLLHAFLWYSVIDGNFVTKLTKILNNKNIASKNMHHQYFVIEFRFFVHWTQAEFRPKKVNVKWEVTRYQFDYIMWMYLYKYRRLLQYPYSASSVRHT